jgi:hypothetical protein
MSYRHALQLIEREGGSISGDNITIQLQDAETVPFEDSFENHYPKQRLALSDSNNPSGDDQLILTDSYSFDFDGVGYALLGTAVADGELDYVFEADIYIDDTLVETVSWPTQFTKRRFYLAWKYALVDGEHTVELRLKNPSDVGRVELDNVVIYGDEIVPDE